MKEKPQLLVEERQKRVTESQGQPDNLQGTEGEIRVWNDLAAGRIYLVIKYDGHWWSAPLTAL